MMINPVAQNLTASDEFPLGVIVLARPETEAEILIRSGFDSGQFMPFQPLGKDFCEKHGERYRVVASKPPVGLDGKLIFPQSEPKNFGIVMLVSVTEMHHLNWDGPVIQLRSDAADTLVIPGAVPYGDKEKLLNHGEDWQNWFNITVPAKLTKIYTDTVEARRRIEERQRMNEALAQRFALQRLESFAAFMDVSEAIANPSPQTGRRLANARHELLQALHAEARALDNARPLWQRAVPHRLSGPV